MKHTLLASLALLSALALPARAQDVPVTAVAAGRTLTTTVINLAPIPTPPISEQPDGMPAAYMFGKYPVNVRPLHPIQLRPNPSLYPSVTDIVWYKDGQRLAATTSTLAISEPTSADSGGYSAVFKSDGKVHTVALGELLVGFVSPLATRAVSLRTFIDPAKPSAIAGFVVSPENGVRTNPTLSVLVRVIGPSLSRFGVSQPLATPKVTLYRADGTEVPAPASQGSVMDSVNLRVATASVGAFPLADGTADVAYLRDLPAGNYTAHVSSASAAAGEVLIEIWTLPVEIPGFGETH